MRKSYWSPRLSLIPRPAPRSFRARAALDLMARGFAVSASVTSFSPLHPKLRELRARGLDLACAPLGFRCANILALVQRTARRPVSARTQTYAENARGPPALVVFSEGNALPPVDSLELCIVRRLPFVDHHASQQGSCSGTKMKSRDATAARLRRLAPRFFVSEGNCNPSEANRRRVQKCRDRAQPSEPGMGYLTAVARARPVRGMAFCLCGTSVSRGEGADFAGGPG